MGKKISVVLPVYNGEKYISRSVESVIDQTYDNWELIIIDDGSRDRTNAIVEGYLEKDGRIKLIRQENQGVSVARNRGIDVASGELMVFLDADDWYEKDAFQIMNDNWKESAQMLQFDYYDVSESGRKTLRRHFKTEKIKFGSDSPHTINELIYCSSEYYKNKNRIKTFFLSPWDKVFDASYVKGGKFEFPPNIFICEDSFFCLNTFVEMREAYFIPYPLYNYYINYRSASQTLDRKFGYDLISNFDYSFKVVKEVYCKKCGKIFEKIYYRDIFERMKVVLWWLAERHDREEKMAVRKYCYKQLKNVARHMKGEYSIAECLLIFLCIHGWMGMIEKIIWVWKRMSHMMQRR